MIMIRTILLLVLGIFVVADDVNPKDLCRNGDKTECDKFCNDKFGAKLISSDCKETDNKRQCTCKFSKQESDEFMIEDEDDEEGGGRSKHPKNQIPHHQNGNGNGNGTRGPKHHGKPSCPKLMPIYRLWNPQHYHDLLGFVTSWIGEAVKGGWYFVNQKGFAAVTENVCNGKKLQPIYLVQNSAAFLTLYTNDLAQVEQKKKEGFTLHPGVASFGAGIQFYCSPKPDPECGATVPLHRFWMTSGQYAGRYFYYLLDEGTKDIIKPGIGRDDGLLCYVWPKYAEI